MKSALQILNRWVLPVVTGVFYALALPPYNHSEVGWVALVPLLFALEGCRPGEAFRRGFLAGLVFFGMTTWWIGPSPMKDLLKRCNWIRASPPAKSLLDVMMEGAESDCIWKTRPSGLKHNGVVAGGSTEISLTVGKSFASVSVRSGAGRGPGVSNDMQAELGPS